MSILRRKFIVFKNAEKGATAIEYAFLAALVSIAIVVAVTSMGTAVSNLFGSIAGVF